MSIREAEFGFTLIPHIAGNKVDHDKVTGMAIYKITDKTGVSSYNLWCLLSNKFAQFHGSRETLKEARKDAGIVHPHS